MARIKIWDLPTRLFHWALVLLVACAFITESLDQMEWHGRVGLTILGLLVFRIVWGFVGSTYARFCTFVKGPQSIKSYLKGEWQGLGHNPLGALSVLAILATVGIQVATGLFANEDGSFFGPLYSLVGEGLSGDITDIHEAMEPVLIALVIAHVAAILFYAHVKKDNLVKPMITGWKEADGKAAEGGGPVAFFIAVAIAVAAVYAASGALLPSSPATAATQAW
ncbi:MAG: cytochrome B [Rhodocyclaceae bacterium]|nr:MAG: cytochrome B [Rhodocyclaceae bacterium]